MAGKMRVIRDGDRVTYVAPGALLPEEQALAAAGRATLAAALKDLDTAATAWQKARQPHSDGVALALRYGLL